MAHDTGSLKRHDPFGTPITTGEKFGFAGVEKREFENRFSIDFIQMGARVYIPSLGRFLQVDPVEGANLNDYIYPLDPINISDFSGTEPITLIISAVLIGFEILDTVGFAVDTHNCSQGDDSACENVQLGMTMNSIPGPSIVWGKKVYNFISKAADKISAGISRFFAKGIPEISTPARNLTEQLVLHEAKGKGTPIMGYGTKKPLFDPRINTNVWTKMQYVRQSGGVQYTVHYLQNRFIPMSKQFKFSDARSIPLK